MQYQLKLNDGSSVDLSFSMYFLNRVCKLANVGFQQVFQYLIGDISQSEKGIVSGGILDDLEIRAQVLAAGIEAAGMAKGDFKQWSTLDGFSLMEQVPKSLTSSVWVDICTMLTQSIIVDSLPKDDAPKKKAGRKKLPSPISSTTE